MLMRRGSHAPLPGHPPEARRLGHEFYEAFELELREELAQSEARTAVCQNTGLNVMLVD